MTVDQAAGQSDPTSTSPIHFTAVFNEPVSGFQNADVTIGGTAGGSKTASLTNPSSDNRTFDVAVTGMTTSGTVTLTVDANRANDAAGNGNSASTSTDNTVSWTQQQSQNTAPAVTITSPTFGQLYAKGSANVNLQPVRGLRNRRRLDQRRPRLVPRQPVARWARQLRLQLEVQEGWRPPTGETEFNFAVGNFNFHSDAYQWLVVSSFKAQFRGTGSVNGVSGYDFRLTGYDGEISGGGGIDKFRIRVTRNGQTVFDNRLGVSEDIDLADPQAIAGGSIVIHKN